jgi:hypothetical protein
MKMLEQLKAGCYCVARAQRGRALVRGRVL